jgi:hypothetical protein
MEGTNVTSLRFGKNSLHVVLYTYFSPIQTVDDFLKELKGKIITETLALKTNTEIIAECSHIMVAPIVEDVMWQLR